MLYDAGTAAIRASLSARAEGQRASATAKLLRAQDVVLELRCALNHDAGEMAARLDSIYAYVFQRLVDANVGRDPSGADEALRLLRELQETWREACLGQQPVAAAAS